MRIIILTREIHKSGSWITDLVNALHNSTTNYAYSTPLLIDVISVDCGKNNDDDEDECCDNCWNEVISSSTSPDYDLLVNRVSDASPSITIKRTLSILALFELYHVPIINGTKCFIIGSNKWLHHRVFQKAECMIPRSIVVSRSDDSNVGDDNGSLERYRTSVIRATNCLLDDCSGCTWPILWKPNSAGFGAGITLLANMDDVIRRINDEWDNTTTTATTTANNGNGALSIITTTTTTITDGTIILQEYLKPRLDTTYRVWFIGGRICGAVSIKQQQQQQQCRHPMTTFTNACAGSATTCTLDDDANSGLPIFTTWDPPEDVRDKVLHIAKIASADCGSVELLYTESDGVMVMGYDGPYYFDLNMVSTLPNTNNMEVNDPDNLWRRCGNDDDDDDNGGDENDCKKDFYDELAEFILTKLPPRGAQT